MHASMPSGHFDSVTRAFAHFAIIFVIFSFLYFLDSVQGCLALSIRGELHSFFFSFRSVRIFYLHRVAPSSSVRDALSFPALGTATPLARIPWFSVSGQSIS